MLNKEKDLDKLLSLIEKGDAEDILSEENSEGFNILMKYELISFSKGIVCLTEAGKKAQTEGVQVMIQNLTEKQLKEKGIKEPIPVKAVVPVLKITQNKRNLAFGTLVLILLLMMLTYYLKYKVQ